MVEMMRAGSARRDRRPSVAVASGHEDTEAADGTFAAFYRSAYVTVARALVLALHDRQLGVEAADEAMVRALERWDRVGRSDDPAGWVFRVGMNWATSVRRRRWRVVPPTSRVREPVVEPTYPDPAVEAAMRDLDVKQRAVVVCRHWLGLDTAATARVLGIAPGTVKSRLSRASAHLADALEGQR